MIKLIMSDMDGTLLDEDGRVPAGFDDMIRQLDERGARFAPASGRQYFALLHQFPQYRDRFIFVAENGTFVVEKGKELFSSTMEPATVRLILQAAQKVKGAYPVVCGKKGAYVASRNEEFFAEMEKYYTQYQLVDDWAEVDDDIIKISICDALYADAEHTIYPILQAFQGKLQVALSSNYWVDIMNFAVNKGIAIQQVQARLHIAPAECAAFGDYMNDLEMMSAVYYSFAMDNAHPQIKAAARFQAPSNADHGVLSKVQEMLDKHLI
jgi:Cof subfamily protein (haloacid dehalogenase superfamily)